MFVIQVIYWVLFVYGLLSFFQDIVTEYSKKIFCKNCRIYICIDDLKENYEIYYRELEKVKEKYKNYSFTIVDTQNNIDDSVIQYFNDAKFNVEMLDNLK